MTDGYEIRISYSTSSIAAGAREVRHAIERNFPALVRRVVLKEVGSGGIDYNEPIVEIVLNGRVVEAYGRVRPDMLRGVFLNHFRPRGKIAGFSARLREILDGAFSAGKWYAVDAHRLSRGSDTHDFLGRQVRIVLENAGRIAPESIAEYRAAGGYAALEAALATPPADIVLALERSGLRGRGGAGYHTYKKWDAVRNAPVAGRYVIVNGDEGDPGAFMDRAILEGDPHRVLEGALIAARAVGAADVFFYVRAEYPLAVKRLTAAVAACTAAGYPDQTGTRVHLREGAGAFVCGEETALISSLEGRRGNPRLRPPYPAQAGLFGRPTLVNNVETLACVPWILRNDPERFREIGTSGSSGTKVFALAGKVARGGLIEVPMGMTIREIVGEIGGGCLDGRTPKAVQIGGPSGGCIPYSEFDTPVDFESLVAKGAMMGSGGLVVLDETDCMVDVARYFLEFTRDESCGKCTFCRVGTCRMLERLERLCRGEGTHKDIAELEELAEIVAAHSLCGLGKTAPNPVVSTLRYFRDEYVAHVGRSCPAGRCAALIRYTIGDGCIGCTICAQNCPVDAIGFSPHERHEIDCEKCIRCGSCAMLCPVDAIAAEPL